MRSSIVVAVLIGCGPGAERPDAQLGIDVLLAGERVISGRVLQQDGTPISGAFVRLHGWTGSLVSDGVMTDANGRYVEVLPSGFAWEGYIRAEYAGFLPTSLWTGIPVVVDYPARDIAMLTTPQVNAIHEAAHVPRNSVRAFVIAYVVDGDAPVQGAAIESYPGGTYRYNGYTGTAVPNGTATAPDGIAYVMNASEYSTVWANKQDMKFTRPDMTASAGEVHLAVVSRK